MPLLRFCGEPGQRITIRYGEMLYPALEEYGALAGRMLQENLREASNIDVYICAGGEAIYKPKFTFHGFRYIEISGLTAPLPLEQVQGILLSSVEQITGAFRCSNPLVNQLVSNVSYSQQCNFISIPTDCPQRNERMGWVGDTHVFCRTATYQSDAKNFYLRNLQAMADLQTVDGRMPAIAPVGGGFGGMNAMNSFDHYSLGCVLSWLYENVLGIQRDEAQPGYRHFYLRPEVGGFGYAEGGIETPYGRIESGWRQEGETVYYRCKVPVNTRATICIGGEEVEVGSGEWKRNVENET